MRNNHLFIPTDVFQNIFFIILVAFIMNCCHIAYVTRENESKIASKVQQKAATNRYGR